MSVKTQTIHSAKWVLGASMVQRCISFITTVVLARILLPSDFGLFALAFVLIDGLSVFKSLGVDYALIQKRGTREEIDKAANTAFIIVPFMGFLLFIVLFVFAPIGAKLLGNASLTPIVRILGLFFILNCLGRIPGALLNREMRFKERSIGDFLANMVYSILAIALALLKFGVWSLVVAYLFKTVVLLCCYWGFSGWRPRLYFDKRLAFEMVNFGKYIFASSFLAFLMSNLGIIVVGRFLGVGLLGFYALALSIATFPAKYITSKLWSVLFPAYSKLQKDPEDLKKAFLKVFKYICLLTVPFGIFIMLMAPDFLRVIYGAKWLAAADVLRIMAIAAIFSSIGASLKPVLLAKGRTRFDFYLGAIYVFLFFVLIVPGALLFKLNGAGLAVLISRFVSALIGYVRMRKILKIKVAELIKALRPSLVGSLIMCAAILVLRLSFNSFNVFLDQKVHQLISIVLTAGTVYIFFVIKIDKMILKEFRAIVLGR